MVQKLIGIVFLAMSGLMMWSENALSETEMTNSLTATGVKKMSDKVSSASLAAEIEKLPEVDFDSAWESDPIKFRTEIKKVLDAKSVDASRPFRRTVWFNQPSRITGKAKYYTLVVSLTLGKSRRLQGDDIFLALQEKKEFSKDEIVFLKEVFLKNL